MILLFVANFAPFLSTLTLFPGPIKISELLPLQHGSENFPAEQRTITVLTVGRFGQERPGPTIQALPDHGCHRQPAQHYGLAGYAR